MRNIVETRLTVARWCVDNRHVATVPAAWHSSKYPEQGVCENATHGVTDAAERYSKASEVIAQGYVEGLY